MGVKDNGGRRFWPIPRKGKTEASRTLMEGMAKHAEVTAWLLHSEEQRAIDKARAELVRAIWRTHAG
jgi:hypothetical protein